MPNGTLNGPFEAMFDGHGQTQCANIAEHQDVRSRTDRGHQSSIQSNFGRVPIQIYLFNFTKFIRLF